MYVAETTGYSSPVRQPRLWLWDPTKFGEDAEALWKPWVPGDRGVVGAAYYQHRLVMAASIRIAAVFHGSMSEFAEALWNEGLAPSADKQQLDKKFAGSRPAQMYDYMAWVQLLGGRILPNLTKQRAITSDRKYTLPTKHRADTKPEPPRIDPSIAGVLRP